MVRLNNSYLNRTGDFGDAKTVKGIDSTSRNMIENVVWNTGAFSWGQSAKNAYQSERGTRNGKECTQGTVYCTDTVTRTTTWTGKIGLIYPSDYGYASTYVNSETGKGCRDNINDNTNYSCKNENWLHNNSSYWTLSPRADSDYSYLAWLVRSSGYVSNDYALYGYGVRPSVYLKSNVSIISGDGASSATAYQIA